MAIFRKKPDDPESTEAAATETDKVFTPNPDKAAKWFKHAKAMADSHQYSSALVYYAHGLQLDPKCISAQEAMIATAQRHLQSGGKKLPGKEIKKLEGPHPTDKMAMAMLSWASEFDTPALGVKALDATIKAQQTDFAAYLVPFVLLKIRQAKKVNRGLLLQLKLHAAACDSWDAAIVAGTLALELDPSDSSLDDELKDLAAQRAMAKGGYEKAAGREGGFREFIKDADKQRQLVQEDSLAGVGGSREGTLKRAKEAYEAAPTEADVLNKYAQILRRQGTDEALEEAHRVYMRGFESTGEYRFRMNAGDILINRGRAELDEIRAHIESAPDSERSAFETRLAEKAKAQLELEAEEYADRAAKYPTDRTLKYLLGDIAFRRGDLGTAMECFQKAKDEPKLRTRGGHYLGRCFAREQWHAEAIAEYREVIENMDLSDQDQELEIRYDLMKSLIEAARADRNSEQARDALEICSQIARKDITYKDIRDRRKEIDQLVRELG